MEKKMNKHRKKKFFIIIFLTLLGAVFLIETAFSPGLIVAGAMSFDTKETTIVLIFHILFLFFLATYPINYLISLVVSIIYMKKNKPTFIPVILSALHILLTVLFFSGLFLA